MSKIIKIPIYLICSLILLGIGAIACQYYHYINQEIPEMPENPTKDFRRLSLYISASEEITEEEQKYFNDLQPLIQTKAKEYGLDLPVLAYIDPLAKFTKIKVPFESIINTGVYRVAIIDGDEFYWLNFPCACVREAPGIEVTILSDGNYMIDNEKFSDSTKLNTKLKELFAKNNNGWLLLIIHQEATFRDLQKLIRPALDCGLQNFELRKLKESS